MVRPAPKASAVGHTVGCRLLSVLMNFCPGLGKFRTSIFEHLVCICDLAELQQASSYIRDMFTDIRIQALEYAILKAEVSVDGTSALLFCTRDSNRVGSTRRWWFSIIFGEFKVGHTVGYRVGVQTLGVYPERERPEKASTCTHTRSVRPPAFRPMAAHQNSLRNQTTNRQMVKQERRILKAIRSFKEWEAEEDNRSCVEQNPQGCLGIPEQACHRASILPTACPACER